MTLKVINTGYNIFFNNSTKKMWKKIRWYEYNQGWATGPDRTEPGRPGHFFSDRDRPGNSWTGPWKFYGPVRSGLVKKNSYFFTVNVVKNLYFFFFFCFFFFFFFLLFFFRKNIFFFSRKFCFFSRKFCFFPRDFFFFWPDRPDRTEGNFYSDWTGPDRPAMPGPRPDRTNFGPECPTLSTID